MRNDRVLLFLVVADFVLVMLTFAGEFALNSTLPLPLRDYTSSAHAILTSILYICSWAGWILLVAVSGPSVTPAAVATIQSLGNLEGELEMAGGS